MITVYTQEFCPKCKVLKQKLDGKHIEYVECGDRDVLISKGVEFTPMLEIDGEMMGYAEAIKWVNEMVVE